MFDIGAPITATISEVENYIKKYLPKLSSDKPLLILSHWDMDHVHCLKYFKDKDLSKYFRGVICNSLIKSLTAKKMYDKIKSDFKEKNICCLSPMSKTTPKTMHIYGKRNILSIYMGERSININFSGICLYVCAQTSVAFTGDLRLSQIKDIHSQEMRKYNILNHILIVPHHGGDYGNKYRKYSHPCNYAIVSVGENHYNHPDSRMIKFLQVLTDRNVLKTIDSGDISWQL